MIEESHPWSKRCKRSGQENRDAEVNPEQVASEGVGDFLTLQNRFRKSIQAEARKQETECCDHGDNTEIGGCKEARKNHGRNHLDNE
jgi:hypothetical protein